MLGSRLRGSCCSLGNAPRACRLTWQKEAVVGDGEEVRVSHRVHRLALQEVYHGSQAAGVNLDLGGEGEGERKEE